MSRLQVWMREVFAAATRDASHRGFKVKGVVAERRHGKTLQRVDLQPDRHSQDDFGRFFVNIWVAFDELDGHSWSARLAHFVNDQPASWELRSSAEIWKVKDKDESAVLLATVERSGAPAQVQGFWAQSGGLYWLERKALQPGGDLYFIPWETLSGFSAF